jgi:hypothetical protein
LHSIGGKNGQVELFQQLSRAGLVRKLFKVPIRVLYFVTQSILVVLAHGDFTPVESMARKLLVYLRSKRVNNRKLLNSKVVLDILTVIELDAADAFVVLVLHLCYDATVVATITPKNRKTAANLHVVIMRIRVKFQTFTLVGFFRLMVIDS